MADDFRGVQRHLARRLARLKGPEGLLDAAEKLSARLELEAPSHTGTLAEALSEMSAVRKTAEGLSIGIGPLSRLGDPSQSTPDTLRNFYDDARFKALGVKRAKKWRDLAPAAKDLLQELRAEGLYGGPAYKAGAPARYYYVQEGGEGAWEASAAAADVMPTRFTYYEIQDWRASDLPEVIGRLLGS